MIEFLKLAICILLSLSAGFIGSLFTMPEIASWYVLLNKPSFNPPNWIFGPVWTILFILMGIALYLVVRKGISSSVVKLALAIFAVQFVLNIFWSFLFFGIHSPLAGLIDIGFLWIFILFTIVAFLRVSPIASIIMIPYLLWVSFASVLNYFIYKLN